MIDMALVRSMRVDHADAIAAVVDDAPPLNSTVIALLRAAGFPTRAAKDVAA